MNKRRKAGDATPTRHHLTDYQNGKLGASISLYIRFILPTKIFDISNSLLSY